MIKSKFFDILNKLGLKRTGFDPERHSVSLFINELLSNGYIKGSSKNIIDLDWWKPLNPHAKIVPGNIYVLLYKSDKFIAQTEYEYQRFIDESKKYLKSGLSGNGLVSIIKNPGLLKSYMSAGRILAVSNAEKYMQNLLNYFSENKFYEVIPTLLVRKVFQKDGETYIHGINLNYCSKDVKKSILEEVYNIDPNYFDKEIWEIAKNGSWRWSDKVAKSLMSDEWLKMICAKYKLTNINLLAHTYKLSHIEKISFVEVWMYQYLPYLNYDNAVDGKSLQELQKMLVTTKFGLQES